MLNLFTRRFFVISPLKLMLIRRGMTNKHLHRMSGWFKTTKGAKKKKFLYVSFTTWIVSRKILWDSIVFTFLKNGTGVRVPGPGGQGRAVPPVFMKLLLALLHSLIQSLDSHLYSIRLSVAQFHLSLGQAWHASAHSYVPEIGRVWIRTLKWNLVGQGWWINR